MFNAFLDNKNKWIFTSNDQNSVLRKAGSITPRKRKNPKVALVWDQQLDSSHLIQFQSINAEYILGSLTQSVSENRSLNNDW